MGIIHDVLMSPTDYNIQYQRLFATFQWVTMIDMRQFWHTIHEDIYIQAGCCGYYQDDAKQGVPGDNMQACRRGHGMILDRSLNLYCLL